MSIEERRKNTASFEVSDMNIENNELKSLAYQIQISFMNLEKNMVTKDDIQSIVDKMIDNHGKECPIKSMKLLTLDNCYPIWKDCNEKHKEESLKKFDTWTERIKKSAGWIAAIAIAAYNLIDWSALIELLSK